MLIRTEGVHGTLSCHLTSDRQVGWDWRLTPDVNLSSGLTSSHVFEKKKEYPFFSLWKQGHSEVTETQCRPTGYHWWNTQSKQTRQTYRQSIETTRRQFTKRWKRIIRPRKHGTKELRNIRVKLNWDEHNWNLFITMVINKFQLCSNGNKQTSIVLLSIHFDSRNCTEE